MNQSINTDSKNIKEPQQKLILFGTKAFKMNSKMFKTES